MKKLLLMLSLVVALALIIDSAPANAEDTGYAFVFAYSHKLKAAYHSLIVAHPAKGQSLSADEYNADIKLIRRMEDAFEQYIRTKMRLNTALFTLSARTGYKSEAIAQNRLEAEKINLKTQGLEMKLVPDFIFKP
ncbi:MAG: hypothetical protein WAU91_01310 [Desulfatitalea sp.]